MQLWGITRAIFVEEGLIIQRGLNVIGDVQFLYITNLENETH